MKWLLKRLFFVLVIASESSAWVRAAGSSTGLRVGSQAGALSSGSGDPHLFALNFMMIVFTTLACFAKLREILAMMVHLRWMLLIYVYSAVTILWSADRGNTLRLSIYLIVGFFQVVYLALYFDTEDQIKIVGDTTILLAVLSVAGQFLLAPAQDPAPGWTGIFPSKNYLGNVMALGIVALILRRGRWTVTRIAGMGLCLALLALSQSFTSYLCVVASAGIVAYVRLKHNTRMLLLASAAGAGVMLAIILPNVVALLLGAGGKDTNLTGRDVIWAFALKYIAMKPLLGWGYASFWPTQASSALLYLGWNPGQAHNGFLELTLEEGLVGLLLLFALLADGLRRGLRELKRGDPTSAGVWLLVMIAYLLLHNVAEADFYQRPAWVVYIIAYVSVGRAQLPWTDAAEPAEEASPLVDDRMPAVPVGV